MTVQELIETLQKFPANRTVDIAINDGRTKTYSDIDDWEFSPWGKSVAIVVNYAPKDQD